MSNCPDECKFCMTGVLLTTLESANKEIARLRFENNKFNKIASDSMAERYALQEQLQLERRMKP